MTRVNTGDHPGSCVQRGLDAPEGVPLCAACGVEEELKAELQKLEDENKRLNEWSIDAADEIAVLRRQLSDIKLDVLELLIALPEKAWNERITGALQRLKARVS